MGKDMTEIDYREAYEKEQERCFDLVDKIVELEAEKEC